MAMTDEEAAAYLAAKLQPAAPPPPPAVVAAPIAPPAGPMTDEQAAAYLAAKGAPRALTKGASEQSWLSGVLDHVKKGFTFGGDKDIEALIGANEGGTHGDRRKKVADRQEAFHEANPWSANIADLAGMVGGTIIPIGRGAGLAGRVAATVLPNANLARGVGQVAADGLVPKLLPTVIGDSAAHQFGMAGLKTGALTTVGDREGNVGAAEAAKGALSPGEAAKNYGFGAVTGVIGNKIAEKVAPAFTEALGFTRQARAEGLDAVTGGERELLKKMGLDGVTDRELIRDLVRPSHQKLSPQQVDDIVLNYGKRIADGETDVAARQAIAAEIEARRVNAASLLPGHPGYDLAHMDVQPSTISARVNAIVGRLNDKNAVPAQLHELVAQAAGGESKNTFNSYRHGVNAPSEGNGANAAANFARQRQGNQHDVIDGIFSKHLGDGDVEQAIFQAKQRIGATNDLYKPVLAAETPAQADALSTGVQDVINRIERENTGSGQTKTGSKILDAIDAFRTSKTHVGQDLEVPRFAPRKTTRDPETGNLVIGPREQIHHPDGVTPLTRLVKQGDVVEERGVYGLKHFLRAKKDLDQEITASMTQGLKGPEATTLTAELLQVKKEIMGVARQTHPEWAAANDTGASARAMRNAYAVGLKTPLLPSTGASAAKQSGDLVKYAPKDIKRPTEVERMFQRGIMGQIKTKLEKAGDTHDLSKFFNNRASRKMMERVLGKSESDAIGQHIQRVALGTKSFTADKNSITSSVILEDAKLKPLMDLAATLTSLNPLNIIASLGRHKAQLLHGRRNDEVMKMLSVHTNEPHKLFDVLARLDRAEQQMRRVQAAKVPQAVRRAAVGGTNALDAEANRKRRY